MGEGRNITKVSNEKSRDFARNKVERLDISDGKTWNVITEPYRPKRSVEQNNLYWEWLGTIADETGNSADAIHEHCRNTFLPAEFYDLDGVTREYRRSTAKLKVGEMARYMDRVHSWAAVDLGMRLPLPPPRTEMRT